MSSIIDVKLFSLFTVKFKYYAVHIVKWTTGNGTGLSMLAGQEEVSGRVPNTSFSPSSWGTRGWTSRISLTERSLGLNRQSERASNKTPGSEESPHPPSAARIGVNRPLWSRFTKISPKSHENSTYRPRFCIFCGSMDVFETDSFVLCGFCGRMIQFSSIKTDLE
jgi:hypothetical protein